MMLDFANGDVGCNSNLAINISLFLIEIIGALLYFTGLVTWYCHLPKWTYYTFSERSQWALSDNRVHFTRIIFHSAMLSVLPLLSLCTFNKRVIDLIVDWTICHCSVITVWDVIWAWMMIHVKRIESTMWLLLDIEYRERI